ncbi:hypothetical protein F5X97DRAFT_309685 [Nemania serpens]|nr:hypothetical protein F5X97DRAFT_309685 [Nemania serpens]
MAMTTPIANTALTNLGPLPTNFALPPSCARDLEDVYKVFTTSEGWYYLLQGPVAQTSCYPSGYNGNLGQYYSPARCPTGFTSACQSLNVAGTVQETVVRCCPTYSNFICQTTAFYGWEETLGCSAPQESAMTAWTVSQVLSGRTALTTYTGLIGGVNAYEIKVGFQSTDFTSRKSTKTRTKSTTSSQTNLGAHPTAKNGASNGSSPGRNTVVRKTGLAAGAAAGIAIGAVAGLLIVVALVWLVIRNKRRRRQQEEETKENTAAAAPPQVVHEMSVEPVAELDGGMTKYVYR